MDYFDDLRQLSRDFAWDFRSFSMNFGCQKGRPDTEVLALAVPLVTSIGFLSQQKEDGREEVLPGFSKLGQRTVYVVDI